jgi:nicotinamidase-related amidase
LDINFNSFLHQTRIDASKPEHKIAKLSIPKSCTLLIIDPQNDFHGGGSLAVPGSDEDSERIASLIDLKGASISEIIVTLDTHMRMHIAHGRFWLSKDGSTSPPPFTVISSADIEAGVWVPRESSLLVKIIRQKYVKINS